MRCRVRGVGTQMTITSQCSSAAKSVVAERRPAVDQRLEVAAHHRADIGSALGNMLRLLRVDIESDGSISGAGNGDGERQADIAEPDHPDHRFALGDAMRQPIKRAGVQLSAHPGLLAAAVPAAICRRLEDVS